MSADLNLITKYRSQLMGIAIIWIMTFHHSFIENETLNYFLGGMGYCGVDIFALCSGIGLFFSLSKNNNIKHFYIKRFLRIMPLTIIDILLLYCLINYDRIPIFSYASLSWLLFYIWYILFCIILYLIFPILFYWYNKNPIYIWGGYIILSIILIVFSPKIFNFWLMWPRFADIIVGMAFAKIIIEKKNINFYFLALGAFVGLLSLYLLHHYYNGDYLNYNGLNFWPAVLFTPFLCIALGKIFEITKYLTRFLEFIGERSLELYFAHCIVAAMLIHYEYMNAFSYYIFSILGAFLLSLLNNMLFKVLKNLHWGKIYIKV